MAKDKVAGGICADGHDKIAFFKGRKCPLCKALDDNAGIEDEKQFLVAEMIHLQDEINGYKNEK